MKMDTEFFFISQTAVIFSEFKVIKTDIKIYSLVESIIIPTSKEVGQ